MPPQLGPKWIYRLLKRRLYAEYYLIGKYICSTQQDRCGTASATRKQVILSIREGYPLSHLLGFPKLGRMVLPMADIKDGFERQSQALKQYCEQSL